MRLLKRYPGQSPVLLRIVTRSTGSVYRADLPMTIDVGSHALQSELDTLMATGAIASLSLQG